MHKKASQKENLMKHNIEYKDKQIFSLNKEYETCEKNYRFKCDKLADEESRFNDLDAKKLKYDTIFNDEKRRYETLKKEEHELKNKLQEKSHEIKELQLGLDEGKIKSTNNSNENDIMFKKINILEEENK